MFTISFNFDETTKKVSNLKVTMVDETVPPDENYISVQDNKLKFGQDALSLLNVSSGDRIQVTYWTVNNQETFPVIGKSEIFTDKDGGNALTKSGTMSFRGNQRTVLLEYGDLFKIEPFKEGIFKLVPIISEEENLDQEKKELDNLNSIDDDLFEDLPF
jgi:hypothetical protein